MQDMNVVIKTTTSYKKYGSIIFVLGLLGIIIAFAKVMLQMLLVMFLIMCIGFILFKAITYIFKFGYILFRGILCIFAFILALGGFLWILNLLHL